MAEVEVFVVVVEVVFGVVGVVGKEEIPSSASSEDRSISEKFN